MGAGRAMAEARAVAREEQPPANQCSRRNSDAEAELQKRLQTPPLFDTGGWVLRMGPQIWPALSYSPPRWAAVFYGRSVGGVERRRWQRDRILRDYHRRGQRHFVRFPPPHAGDDLPRQADDWLHCPETRTASLQPMLQPAPANDFEALPIAKRVNKVAEDDADLWQESRVTPAPSQMDLF